jgi:hypothetical protein
MANIIEGYCNGCTKINESLDCTVYPRPMAFVNRGCAFSPIAIKKAFEEDQRKRNVKGRAGQQKQKKRK